MSKKNNEENQKKESNFIPILVVLLLIIAILMIAVSLGFGGGLGSGNGNGSSVSSDNSSVSEDSSSDNSETKDTQSSETDESVTEKTTEAVTYIDVTVSGSAYIMDGNETTLDAVTETASDDNIVVRIKDDNAVADAMDSLISALDEKNISYIEPTEE